MERGGGSLSRTTRWLHWGVGLGILAMLVFGFWLQTLPSGEAKSPYVQVHKSFGMLLLVLVLARVVWRWREGFPVEAGHPAWERRAALATHLALVAATLAMPVSGIVRSLAYARPISVFGLPVIPQVFAQKQEGLYAAASAVHDWTAWALAAVILLHVGAALKHHLVDRDATLRRMVGTARAGR